MTGLLDAPADRRELELRVSEPGPGEITPTLRNLRAQLRPLLWPAGCFVASRLLMLAVGLVAAALDPGLHLLQTFGSIFDGRWYLMIAQHGYPHHLFQEGDGSRWAFFPAFPLAVRALSVVTGLGLVGAALAAGFAFGLTSAVAIWLAVREVFGRGLADRTVLLYVFCPTAYVLSLAYTEGLFLTAAALCLLALSRRAWVSAGLCAVVAGLTRNAGIAVVLAVLVTALPTAWRERTVRPLVGAAVAPLGLASFMAYGWAMVGTPVAFLSAERFWQGQHFVWFTTPIAAAVAAVHQGPTGATFVANTMAAGALVLGFLGIRWLDHLAAEPGTLVGTARTSIPSAWWVYTVGALLVAYSAYFSDSIPRYAMAAFPLFVAYAWRLRTHQLWLAIGAMAFLQAALLFDVLSAVHPVLDPLIP